MNTEDSALIEFRVTGHPKRVEVGTTVRLEVRALMGLKSTPVVHWKIIGPRSSDRLDISGEPVLDFVPTDPGAYTVTAHVAGTGNQVTDQPTTDNEPEEPAGLIGPITASRRDVDPDAFEFEVRGPGVVASGGPLPVSLQRTAVVDTSDQVLWTIIRDRTNAIGFRRYKRFIDEVMCNREGNETLAYTGTQAYRLLQEATDAFLMQEVGVVPNDQKPDWKGDDDLKREDPTAAEISSFLDEERARYNRTRRITTEELKAQRALYYEQLRDDGGVTLPYLNIIRERLADVPLKPAEAAPKNCYGVLRSRLTGPIAMELIWSYWHEEGMLVQTLNTILARFQNRRLVDGQDPLARLDLDPLRPLANLFWGWGEDELHRLTVRRRAFEYDHEYGLTLLGKALPDLRTADSRSRFLESFHTLLHYCHQFFRHDDDTTVLADGFPLLNALRETHLVLAEGAHNQFGDLPSAARAEMLIMQWLLARPEMGKFLGGRVMVPYEESWMDRVDAMKQLQGWGETSVTHTRDLGVFGEQLVLGIRYGNWSVVNDPHQASNWARYWRPEIQRYMHAYRAATGVDLTERADATLPAQLLQRRMVARPRVAS